MDAPKAEVPPKADGFAVAPNEDVPNAELDPPNALVVAAAGAPNALAVGVVAGAPNALVVVVVLGEAPNADLAPNAEVDPNADVGWVWPNADVVVDG